MIKSVSCGVRALVFFLGGGVLCRMTCGILVPQPGIECVLSAVGHRGLATGLPGVCPAFALKSQYLLVQFV